MPSINLERLGFEFASKPLLIGGKAMEYYGLRKAGADVDFVITVEDYERLARKYPDNLRDIGGDLGVCVFEFEIWRSICLFDYRFLSMDAVEKGEYSVISLEKLLFLKALGVNYPRLEVEGLRERPQALVDQPQPPAERLMGLRCR